MATFHVEGDDEAAALEAFYAKRRTLSHVTIDESLPLEAGRPSVITTPFEAGDEAPTPPTDFEAEAIVTPPKPVDPRIERIREHVERKPQRFAGDDDE